MIRTDACLPAKWEDIKHHCSIFRVGTRPHDIHPEEDMGMQTVHHTHCMECDYSLGITTHAGGNGIICDACLFIKLEPDSFCPTPNCHNCDMFDTVLKQTSKRILKDMVRVE